MFVEILPNIMPPILVETTVRLGYAIFTVATLSFIGFGIQPPSPDWGLSISTNYGMISAGAWWAVAFDGFAIASLVVAVNLVADGIPGGHSMLDGISSANETIGQAAHKADALVFDKVDVSYRVRGIPRRVLRELSFTIGRGEAYGLVGESGCGKSTAALSAVRYLPRNGKVSAGTILVNGRNIVAMGKQELRDLRRTSVSMVYQDPGRSLNPSLPIGRAGRGGLRDQRSGAGTRAGQRAGDSRPCADFRSAPGRRALSASAFRRHAAAGRHRHGARAESGAADSRRADHRARPSRSRRKCSI